MYSIMSQNKILSNYEEKPYLGKQTKVIIQSTIQCDLDICGSKHVESINILNVGLRKFATYNDVSFII